MANGWQSCGSSLLACISVNFRGFYNHLPMVTAGYSPHCSLCCACLFVCLFFPLWILKGREQRTGLARGVRPAPWAAPWDPQGESHEAVSPLVLRSLVLLCCSRSRRHSSVLSGPAGVDVALPAASSICSAARCRIKLVRWSSAQSLLFPLPFFFFFQVYNWLI